MIFSKADTKTTGVPETKTKITVPRDLSEDRVSAYELNCTWVAIKMLSYRRETALQGALVLAKSGRLELGDKILRTL